jgi:hypothetical protein
MRALRVFDISRKQHIWSQPDRQVSNIEQMESNDPVYTELSDLPFFYLQR